MAKRLRLNPETKRRTDEITPAEKSMKIQELLSDTNLEKLRRLDAEMTAVMQKTHVTLEERIHLFEEKLAEFRKVKDTILRNGIQEEQEEEQEEGGEGVKNEALKNSIKDLIKEQLKELMDQKKGGVDTLSDGHQTPASSIADAAFSSPSYAIGPTPERTPSNTSRKRKLITPQASLLKKKIHESLVAIGSSFNNNKLELSSSEAKTKKKKKLEYNMSFYDRTVNYITSADDKIKEPSNSKILQKIIMNALSKRSDFRKLLSEYPKLKKVYASVFNMEPDGSITWSTL